ncbi:MAG: molybdopterin-binding protein [Anaerolineales bacterium]|jgi:molybdopterin molybdotransferase
MPEFLNLLPPDAALEKLLHAIPEDRTPASETVPTAEALDRVLCQTIAAPHTLPPFDRSTVDGYALRAKDTFGASPSLPAYLTIAGEVEMGKPALQELATGQAIVVHTGGMIPPGSDAVVMLEDTQWAREGEIEILRAAAVGENILQEGEDVKSGDTVFRAGQLLRAQEIGGLMAFGVTQVQVARRPQVGILSTGDEIVPPDATPQHGQVRDVNSYTLSALVHHAGGTPLRRGIVSDRRQDLLRAAEQAQREDDVLIITAGSSVSARDITADVIGSLGPPGVLVHGVSIKPGKPTILAVADGVPMIGLPGNPVSALVSAGLFLVPVIQKLLGIKRSPRSASVSAQLSVNIASKAGREDYLPVSLLETPDGLVAEPVYGRSNLIFTLIRADGLIRIPAESTGVAAGTSVAVRLF